MNRIIKHRRLALTTVLWLATTSTVHAVIIDTFDAGNMLAQVFKTPFGTLSTSPASSAAASALGGTRQISAGFSTTPAIGDSVQTQVVSSSGILAFSLGSGNSGQGASAWGTTGALGADLTESGTHDAITIRLLSSDGPFNLALELVDGSATSGTLGMSVLPSPAPTSLGFEFANFSNFALLDFTDISTITLSFATTSTALDMRLGTIRTASARPSVDVAEPVTTSLVMIGLLGLFANHPRRMPRSRGPHNNGGEGHVC